MASTGLCGSAGGPEEMMTRQGRVGEEGHSGAAGRDSSQYNLKSRKARELWPWMALLLWLLSCLLFSIWIFSSLSSQSVEMRRAALASICEERARILEDQVKVSMNHLQALGIVVSTFHHSRYPSAIDQMTFARYVERTAFDRPLTRGLAYAARVTHEERELFEQEQEWSIKMMRSSSSNIMNITKQSPAEEYAPVIFANDAFKHTISFDMLSGAADRENVLRARQSGKVVLTAPFKLLNYGGMAVILTYAVYKSELRPNATEQERIQSTAGYLGGIFDIETHVDELLQKLAGKQSVMVQAKATMAMDGNSIIVSNSCGFSTCWMHISY
nr:unnamed protein product [Digitaria exilis]